MAQNGINRWLNSHQPAPSVRRLQVLLQVGVVVEGHPALVAHDVLGLQVNLVDVLRQIRVLAFTVRTFCLDMHHIKHGREIKLSDLLTHAKKTYFCSFMDNSNMLSEVAVLLSTHRARRPKLDKVAR